MPEGVHSVLSPAEGVCYSMTELPRDVAGRGLALQGLLLELLTKGLCAPGTEAAVARACFLWRADAATWLRELPMSRRLSASSQARALRIPSCNVCFGALPSLAFRHLFHTGAGPLIISGY